MSNYFPFAVSPWELIDDAMNGGGGLGRFLLSRAGNPAGHCAPVNIFQGEDGLIVDMAIPGIPKEAIDVSVNGGMLSISVDTDSGKDRKNGGFGSFERGIELPFPVVAADTKATFANGVLRVVLPKAPEAKPRKIEIGQ